MDRKLWISLYREMSGYNYILFRDYPSFTSELVDYRNTLVTYSGEVLYLITPRFTVCAVEENSEQVTVTCRFTNSDFLKVLNILDNISIQQYCRSTGENNMKVRRDFMSTRKIDPLSSESCLVCLEIPKNNGKSTAKVYDDYSYEISSGVINRGFKGQAVIQPLKVEKAGNLYKQKWKIHQLKIKIPEVRFNKCMLDDGGKIDEEEVEILSD